MNTLSVDGEFFESGKKKLRIQKYPDNSAKVCSSSAYFFFLISFFDTSINKYC